MKKKKFLMFVGISVLFFILVIWVFFPRTLGPDDLKLYKGIPNSEIPQNCLEFREDICGLFSCMVNFCWCQESPEAILKWGKIIISNEEEASSYVQQYLDDIKSEYKVEKVLKLNNIFYNVFLNNNGNEEVYTLAVDGTIIKTVCGV